ncbi:putative Multi-domain non-ribosomal peptide synthetase [Candidatus Nitrospira nitrosa]|uniref:Putative Multi-domain non-ribosomal peptide synthetase n=1 Tax=Candidatus Nitrospira nitrosa TaxID=1742972 RepID=A0A0S4LHC8_9BACT|nr:non-ribosomal peptide synthetase [Candidatus Nitrospira nitrosa]CUS36977.1 putative Multi-domain non-ribosomal peptide synthetase [Candidatus Nitrospira nitrosa]
MQPTIAVQGFRLSPQQKRLWVLQQTFGAVWTQGTLSIQGILDRVRLERAVHAAVDKHEAFRTLFCREPGVKVPLQVIAEDCRPVWETVDIQSTDAAMRATTRDELLEEHRRQTIDWEQGPPVRCTLCRLSDHEHWLLISLPAMCADARTLHNLAGEIAAGYGAAGHKGHEEPVQYTQFAEWQNELLADQDAANGRRFWGDMLVDQASMTLPFECTRQETGGWPTETLVWNLSGEVVASLLALSERYETPVEALLLAAWQVVLGRVGDRPEYLMALLSDGRKYDELESGMGLFAKWVPLRCRIDLDTPFRELAAAVWSDQQQVREWQEYFLWDGRAEGIDFTTTELVGFEFQTLGSFAQTGDIVFSFEPSAVRFEPLKLTLTCTRRSRSIQLRLQADSKLVHTAALSILREAMTAVLTGAAAQPETCVGLLPLLSESKRSRLLHTGHGTAHPLQTAQSLVTLFEHQAEARPDATAVVCGDCRLTYAELNARANQVAHGLNRRGVGQGDLVGLCVERSVEMVAGLLGVLKSGAAYVPLDPENSMVRLTFEIAQAGIAVVLTQAKWRQRLPATGTTALGLDFQDWAFAEEPSGNPDRMVHPMELAYVIYTSGSTGVPKGVAVTHLGVVNYTGYICRAVHAEAGLSYATVSTLSADLGNTVIFASLVSGGCLHVIGYDTATDGRKFGEYCANHPIDVLKIVPAHFQSLLATAEDHEVLPRGQLVLGGDVLSHALADHITASGRCRLLNHYGPTETTIGCLTFPVEAQHEDVRLSTTVPIGRPIDNAEAYILDERLDQLPVGIPGELYLGGAGLARGYLGRPDLTAQRFVPHPFASQPGSRLYKTGDLARILPDGTVEFLGRTDFQIKLRGYRIELGEIEARLTEHPGIQQAVVTARASQAGEKYLAAYIVARDSAGEPAGWREFLKECLPDYMIPTALLCLPALPLNQNGKVDRALLPEPEAYLASNRRYVAPRNPSEEMLTGIWATILKRDRIGIHDDFFDLGGHSLLATQVMARVRSVFRVELPLRTLFEATTVAQLAEAIQSARLQDGDMDMPPVSRVQHDGPVPLSFSQQRLWVLTQLEPDGASYNLPIALRLSGTLDVKALEWSVNELVRRHEVLRTTVALSDGQPIQIVAPATALPLPVVTLDHHVDKSEREAAVLRLATAEAQRPFELAYGPMLRVTLLRLDVEEHVLLLTMHHIVSDAWSSHILVREMTELYVAQVQSRPAALPELPVQYADFAIWQRQWLSGTRLDRQLDYWKKRLADALEPLNLLMDHPRPPVQTSHGASLTVSLSPELSSAMTELSRREGVTLFMTLLAGFYALLFKYTGRPDLVVGSPIANRTRSEIEGLIGFFVNTLALRADLSGSQTIRELLALVRQVCLGAYTHQDVPFEKLVEVLQPVRDVSYSPIFQVMFELQNAPTSELAVPGLQIATVDVEPLTAKFDLTLSLCENEAGLTASMEYNSDLFSADSVMRMLRHYELILQGMAVQPDTTIEDLRLLTDEKQRLLTDWNVGPRLSLPDRSFAQLFEAQASATPDRVAAVCMDRRVTYQELNRRANRVAHALRLKGVEPEMVVAVLGDRNLDFLAMLLGIVKTGGMYLPLDTGHPDHRLRHMLAESRPRVLLTTETSRQRVMPLQEGLSEHEPSTLLTMEETQSSVNDEMNPFTSVHPRGAAYVIYTSGSTGTPKGAIVEHRGMLNHLWGKLQTLELTADDVIAQTASQCFDISIWQFLAPLLCGGRVCIVPDDIAHDPGRLLHHVEAAGVTILEAVPAMLQGMLDMAANSGESEPALVRLRMVLPTGEALPASLCRRWLARYPVVPLINAYGPAECADDVALYPVTQIPEEHVTFMPVGRPVPNIELYVLSPSLKPLPIGVVGELCVAGVGVGRGYLCDSAKTAEAFIPHPFACEPGARLYRTGDTAKYLPNGDIQFLGRMDHQVKVRGFRIELGEVEAQLLEHPEVHEAVVVVKEDVGGDKRLVAYVAGGASHETLHEFLRERVPDYMVPSTIVVLESLPRNANGKVDRRSLPEPDLRGSLQTFVAPRTDMETRLAREWAEVLGLPQVGIHDNFFDLGGHSLTAVQLVSRIQRIIGNPIALLDLFQAPTVAGLVERISGQAEAASSPFVVLQAGREGAPLFCFDPTGTHVAAYQSVAYSLGQEQPVYGLPLGWIFSEPWNRLSMDLIAARYAVIIRDRQKDGPYLLLGWSNGGAIALAVAQQLERQGQSVNFLGILDTQFQTMSDSTDSVEEELLHYIQGDRREAFLAVPEVERQALSDALKRLGDEDRVEYGIRWAQDRKLLSREESEASIAALKVAYALDRESAGMLRAAVQNPLQAPIHAWWTSATLRKHGKAPVDWSVCTRGIAVSETVHGEHADVVRSIQVHQRISEILSMLRGGRAQEESYAVQP